MYSILWYYMLRYYIPRYYILERLRRTQSILGCHILRYGRGARGSAEIATKYRCRYCHPTRVRYHSIVGYHILRYTQT
jgi:hypothetical protein